MLCLRVLPWRLLHVPQPNETPEPKARKRIEDALKKLKSGKTDTEKK